jgi:hypothetical protein
MFGIHCRADTDSNCECVRFIKLKAVTVLNYFFIIYVCTPYVDYQEQMPIIILSSFMEPMQRYKCNTFFLLFLSVGSTTRESCSELCCS